MLSTILPCILSSALSLGAVDVAKVGADVSAPPCCRVAVVTPAGTGSGCATISCCKLASGVVAKCLALAQGVNGAAPVVLAAAPGEVVAVHRVVGADGDEPAGGAWLGVQIGEVPEALAAQLKLDGRGLVVLNVATGSPAEQSGIELHDVITAIDGRTVEGDARSLVQRVREHQPGDRVSITVLRDGVPKLFEVRLAEQQTGDALTWRFEHEPSAEVEERIRTRGHMMLRDQDGKWIVKNLGDLSDLGEDIQNLVPDEGSQASVFVDGDRKSVRIAVNKDGQKVVIRQKDGGTITVQRTDPQGNTSEATYDTEEDMQNGDPEAYELYQGKGAGMMFHFDMDGVGNLTFDLEDLHNHLYQWRGDVEEHMQEAHKAYQEALKELKNLDGFSFGNRFWHDDGSAGDGAGVHAFRALMKPRYTFQVDADGRIEARIRKGDTEVVREFRGESDLERQDPKLYQKYEKTKAADQDE